jgi:hypothetical protein
MSVEPNASLIDYDLYDSGTPSGDGSRGGYFQRLGVSRTDSYQWNAVREAVVTGRLDENPATKQHELTIGVVRRYGTLWLYRFRLGLRDSFGRTGRIIFVLVRCSGSGPLNVPLVSRLLSATDELSGCPLQLTPLNLAATWTGIGSGRANHIARWLTESSIGNEALREGAHAGYHLDGSGGVLQVTHMSQAHGEPPCVTTVPPGPIPPVIQGPSSPRTTSRPRSDDGGRRETGGGTGLAPVGRRGVFIPFPTESWQWAAVAGVALIVGVLIGTRLGEAEIGADRDSHGERWRVLKLNQLSPSRPRPPMSTPPKPPTNSSTDPESAVQGDPAPTDQGNASRSSSTQDQHTIGEP